MKRMTDADYGDRNITGRMIKKRREEMGMKQRELLRLLQVRGLDFSFAQVVAIERQQRFVCDYELQAIADILKVNVDYFFPDGTVKTSPPVYTPAETDEEEACREIIELLFNN